MTVSRLRLRGVRNPRILARQTAKPTTIVTWTMIAETARALAAVFSVGTLGNASQSSRAERAAKTPTALRARATELS